MPRSTSTSLCLAALALPFAAAWSGPGAAEVFKQVSPSVVVVRSSEPGSPPGRGSQGSGVVIAPETVITNAHVVSYSTELSIEQGGKSLPATVEAVSLERDLCRLAVPGLAAPAVSTLPLENIEVGQSVFAIGAPKGLDLTLSQGLVSSIRRRGRAELVQTSAAISRGSSGGGLFDEKGRLVGITTMMVADGQNLNFAVPADWIARLDSLSLVATPQEGRWFLELTHHKRRKEFADVIRVGEAWTAAAPGNGYAHTFLGDGLVLAGQPVRAEEAYRRGAETTAPAFLAFRIGAWKGLGDLYLKLHRYTDAIEAFGRFIEAVEELGDLNDQQKLLVGSAHELSARALVQLGRFDEAVARQAEVEKVALQAVAPPLNSARIMRRKGDLAGALKWLDAAEAKAAGHANVLLERGMTYLRMDQPAKALPLLEKASREKPWDVYGKPLLAEAYMALGRQAEAKAALASASEDIRADPAVARRLGFLQLQGREFAAAAASLERALAVVPRDPEAWRGLGTAHLRTKEYSGAAEAFANAATLDPKDAKVWYRLGVLRSKLGDHAKSAQALERAVELQPGSEKLLYRLGMAQLAAKDKAGVRRTLKRLAPVDRARATALKRRALASPLFRR